MKSTISCVGWDDRKMVYMLGTTPVSSTSNSEVEKSVKVGNKWQKTAVTQPSIISDYKSMRGVDLIKRVASYTRLIKGSVW